MYVLQMGQLRSFGEHLSHETRCPQGRKTVLMSLSMQTLHVFASRSRRFSAISRCSSSSATKHCRVSSFIISNSTISKYFQQTKPQSQELMSQPCRIVLMHYAWSRRMHAFILFSHSGDYFYHQWIRYIQGAPIKQPLGKIHYLSYCKRFFFSSNLQFYRGYVFAVCCIYSSVLCINIVLIFHNV